MGYFSTRHCDSAPDKWIVNNRIDLVAVPKTIKLPEHMKEYVQEMLPGRIRYVCDDDGPRLVYNAPDPTRFSDECCEHMRTIHGLCSLYDAGYMTLPIWYADGQVWGETASNLFFYNRLLAVNWMMSEFDMVPEELPAAYQIARFLMPPLNEFDNTTFQSLLRIYAAQAKTLESASDDAPEYSQKDLCMAAITEYEKRRIKDPVLPVCSITKQPDGSLFLLQEVGGGIGTDIKIPVFCGEDALHFTCKLVPTSQEVVNSLRGYVTPKVDPLPEYKECSNVTSAYFPEDFVQRICPKFVYAGLVSISAYLNNRVDDAPDEANLVDTFYKFVEDKA